MPQTRLAIVVILSIVSGAYLQASSPRIKQLEAENAQLRDAATKRSQALAQARHFIENNLQRSSSLLKDSTDTSAAKGNGAAASSIQSHRSSGRQ